MEEHVTSQAVIDELQDLYRGLEVARAQLVEGEIVKAMVIMSQVSSRLEPLTRLAAVAPGGDERPQIPSDRTAAPADLTPANDGSAGMLLKQK